MAIPFSGAPILASLPRGARLPEDLVQVCRDRGLEGAVFVGLGAVSEPVIAFYHLSSKRYEERTLQGDWEVVSLVGNLTRKEGAPFLHAHIALADAEGAMRGGHLVQASVAVTLEVTLWPVDPQDRRYLPDIGLFLLPSPASR